MTPTNNKIIVRVDLKQKDVANIGGVEVRMTNSYNTNYRERSPVIAEVVNGNTTIFDGSFIVCHHNNFYEPSPYHLEKDLYSIPFNKTIFGILDSNGELTPVCGNVFCNRVDIETALPLPPDQRKKHINRGVVIASSVLKYKEGYTIFTRPNALYDIVYIFDKQKITITKVSEDMICGVIAI